MAVTLKNQTCCRTPVQSIDSLQFLHGNLRLVLFLLSTLYFRTVSSIPYAVSQVSSCSQDLHTYDLLVHRLSSDSYHVSSSSLVPSQATPHRSLGCSQRLLSVIKLQMMLWSRKLQSLFNSLCPSSVARKIESAFRLWHQDGFINSHTTIRLVLSYSSEKPSPNFTRLSDVGMEVAY